MFGSGNDETETDQQFFDQCNDEFGPFVCDVAASIENRKHSIYFGPDHYDPTMRDCLKADWPTYGPCWMNPPYSKPEEICVMPHSKCKKQICRKRMRHLTERRPGCEDFVRKAAEQREHGVTTVALLAARTDNEWFHAYIYDNVIWDFRPGVTVRFLPGRQRFEGHDNSAPFPSMLAIFRP
jgi:site-specific DNA-methyltransferase (adenine-specific)